MKQEKAKRVRKMANKGEGVRAGANSRSASLQYDASTGGKIVLGGEWDQRVGVHCLPAPKYSIVSHPLPRN